MKLDKAVPIILGVLVLGGTVVTCASQSEHNAEVQQVQAEAQHKKIAWQNHLRRENYDKTHPAEVAARKAAAREKLRQQELARQEQARQQEAARQEQARQEEANRKEQARQEAAREAQLIADRTVLDIQGSGINSTKRFTVTDDWDVVYAYNCENFGQSGNFSITVQGDRMDVAVNELALQGSSVSHMHGAGNVYLEINSECNWGVKVVNV
jgi:hypothetical protein